MLSYKEFHELNEDSKKEKPKGMLSKLGKVEGGALLAGTIVGGAPGALAVGGGILAARTLKAIGKGGYKLGKKLLSKSDSESEELDTKHKKELENVDSKSFSIEDHLNNPRKVADFISHGNANPKHINMIVNHIDEHMKQKPRSDLYRDALNTLTLHTNSLSNDQAKTISKYHHLLNTDNFHRLTTHPVFNDSNNIHHFITNSSTRSHTYVLGHPGVTIPQLQTLSSSNNLTIKNKANRLLKQQYKEQSGDKESSKSSGFKPKGNKQNTNNQNQKSQSIDEFITNNENHPSKLYSLLVSGKQLKPSHINKLVAFTHKSLTTKKNSQYKPILNKLVEHPNLLSNDNARFLGLHHKHLTDNNFKLLTSHGYFIKNGIGDIDNHNLRSVKFTLTRPGVSLNHYKYYINSKDQDVQKYIQNGMRNFK